MSRMVKLTTETPWFRLETTDADWKKEDPAVLSRLLEQLLLIRTFEEKILELHGQGLVHGPAHASIGQEGGAVGAMSVLGSKDKINGTHRAHHQFLAKFLNHKTAGGYDPRKAPFTEDMRDVVRRSMAEIMGLTPGYCGGRGGSMHMRWDEAGVLGTNAIVGGNPPHAAGYAFADKLRGTGNITVAFFGDGALQNGASAESLNLAGLYDLPVIFFVENNQYAVSTTVRESTREVRLTSRGAMLGVPSVEVDGMDVLAVRKAMQWAVEQIRKDRGPILVEAQCYRFFHQQGPWRGSAFGYRTKEEEDEWMKRDPVAVYPAQLIQQGVVTKKKVDEIKARVREVVDWSAASLTETDPGTNKLRIVPALWPDAASVEYGIRGPGTELSGARMRELEDYPASELQEVKLIDSIALALQKNMERDPSIVVMGEDVHRMRGGTTGSTKGSVDQFPDRVFAMPICENGFTGLGLGASQNGLRPVVDIMYADFALVAADQLFNQTAKVRHMFGGEHPVPMVVRSRVASGFGYGSQHSMDAGGLFVAYPGWRVVAPSTPFDYIGLMNSAIRSDDPVLVIDHQEMYQTTGMIPKDGLDYCIPFGKAKVVRGGTACTMIAIAPMVGDCLKAAEAEGIDAEVIDLRTIDPFGLDWETLQTSIAKTNRAIVVEQNARGTSVGARIIGELQRRCFSDLDHEIVHVTGTWSAPTVSKVLNEASLARLPQVRAGLRQVMGLGQG